MAVGLSEAVADALAADSTVGSPERLGTELPATKIVALVGEFGTGKSVTAERLHQASIEQAIADPEAPVPVFLEARFIERRVDAEIRQAADRIGDPEKTGVYLILDGLDEPGPVGALDILSQSRRAILQWPNSRAVITVRPGLDLGDTPCINHPDMTSLEIESLLERVGAGRHLQHPESSSIRDAMRLPLFALIAAVLDRQGVQMPRSRGALLAAIASKALSRSSKIADGHVQTGLRKLALLSISRNRRVPVSEVGNQRLIEAMCDTHLAVRRGMTLSFSLPIFEQYFAGQAILEDGLPRDILDQSKLSDWQDALVLAVSMGSWSSASALLESIASDFPGIASAIVTKSVPQYDREEDTFLPTYIECGNMVRHALAVWVSGILPLGGELGLTRSDGSVTAIAIGVQGSHLSWGIVSPDRDKSMSDIIPAGPEVRDLCARLGSGIVSSSYAAWPWRWTLSQIAYELEKALSSQNAVIPDIEATRNELDWTLAKAIVNQGSINHRPIPVDVVSEALDRLFARLPRNVQAVSFGKRIFARESLEDFDNRLHRGDLRILQGSLSRSYPVPDVESHGGGWIWSGYSDEDLRTLVEDVYTNALHIYEAIVRANFPKLLPTLGIGGALPLRLEGTLVIGRDSADYAPPSLWSKSVLLDSGETSLARISLGAENGVPARDWDQVLAERAWNREQVRRLRPHSDGWLTLTESWNAVDHVFGDTPAIDQAFQWLWSDLRRLGFVRSNAPRWHH
ncbi:NACHT domain-containing protein [Actinomadura sp. ATCC 39365]